MIKKTDELLAKRHNAVANANVQIATGGRKRQVIAVYVNSHISAHGQNSVDRAAGFK